MTTNEMIIEAITTDSRKRKARNQTALENLGYEIIKNHGWEIYNRKTNRYISLGYNDNVIRTNYDFIKFGVMWSRKLHKYIDKPLSVIDFENLLNTEKKPVMGYTRNCSDSVYALKCALNDRKRYTNKLNNIMAEFQTKIDAITMTYRRNLKDAEDTYKWNLEYSTNGLTTANKTIEKLLKKA